MTSSSPAELEKYIAEEVERRVRARLEEIGAGPVREAAGGWHLTDGAMAAPEELTAAPELARMIDTRAIQALMDDFYQLASIPMSIIDLKGNILVGVGWQKVCMQFHRTHPEACKHCIESDTLLTADIPPGEYRLYKCKNNMWDIATPILVGGRHVGNILSGQFFFADEPMDQGLFRAQAREYGFDEEEYLETLKAVPRLSRETVNTGMAFLLKLAQMLSQLSFSNYQYARAMAERDGLLASLRESESRFRTLADHISQLAWMADEKGWIFWYNQRWHEYTGATMEEMAGWGWRQVHHPAHVERVVEKFSRFIEAGEVWEDTFPLRGKDGRYRWFLSRAVPIKDEQGRVQRWFGTNTDITELRETQQTLEKTVTELARSNRELEQFAYIASHDLQTPLRAVTGFLDLLSRRYHGKLDPEADEFIAFAVEGAERMHQLINDILAFSRVGTRGKPFVPVESREPLKQALDHLRHELAESRAEVTSEELPLVTGDRNQLAQLFQNLLGNAIKYHKPAEPPRIHLAAEEKEDAWEFRVADNGIGIAPQYAERIFQIFQRLHTVGEYPGTGIGLAICKKIVERHGGRIWVESAPGKGSTFYFTLPKG